MPPPDAGLTMTRRKQLGLVGFGQFGRFAARHLRAHFDIVAADVRPIDAQAEELGVRAGSVAEAASSPFVLLAVPVQALPATLDAVAGALRDGALVVDVCSVKVAPLRWMRERLPDGVEILGTHPMFGPRSAPDSLDGNVVVVCPERTERTSMVCAFLEGLGLEVIVSDAATHDRQAAHTQALAQYVGRALLEIDGADFPIATPASKRLRDVARIVGDDSRELFAAIQKINPYALQMRRRLRERLDELDREIERSPVPE